MNEPTKPEPRPFDVTVLLIAVHDHMESELYKPHPDAPGHCHDVRGRWDEDGSVCEWCALWDRVREFVKQNTDSPSR